ncbi:MAG: hypothetical protein ATN32_00825 [Candidatus Epulonipiscium fishelsonii]|nr:MAG: hypothetical protein ATN32_00825 [Epulopiscium sp. AS2M-Bin002]
MAVGAVSGITSRQYVQGTSNTKAIQAQPPVEEVQPQNAQVVQEQEENSSSAEITDSATAVSNAQNILTSQINQNTVNQVSAVSEDTEIETESNPVNDILNQIRDISIEGSKAFTDGYKGILQDKFEELKVELSAALEESGSEDTLESLGLEDLDVAAEGSIQTIENAYAQINGTSYSTSGDLSVGVGDSEAVAGATTATPEEDTQTDNTQNNNQTNNDQENNNQTEEDEYDAFKEFTGATLQNMYKYESYSSLLGFMNGSKSIYDILM